MSQTETLNVLLARRIRKGVSSHVSGCYDRQGQLWATSSHRMHYENAKRLLVEMGGISAAFATTILEKLMGGQAPHRVFFYATVDETNMKMVISSTITDTTAQGIIITDGVELSIDDKGKITQTEVPVVQPVRVGFEPLSYFVFYLPPIATLLTKE